MPPDGEMDTGADVYAAGLIIYEMITGLTADSFPHLGDRVDQVAGNRTLCALNRLALKACQDDPKQRFQDAEEMLSALKRMMQTPRPSRRIAVMVGTAMLLIVLPAAS
jgi:serine/threonine protein kinase